MKHFFLLIAIMAFPMFSFSQERVSKLAVQPVPFSRLPENKDKSLNSILDEVPSTFSAAHRAKIRQELSETWEAYWDNNQRAHPDWNNDQLKEIAFKNTWSFFLQWSGDDFDFYWETDQGKD